MNRSKWILVGILALAFGILAAGCRSAGVTNFEAPANERSVLILFDDFDTTISVDGDAIYTSGFHYNAIIQSGTRLISANTGWRKYIGDYGYVRYTEIWLCDYNFEPGETYKINLTKANIKAGPRQNGYVSLSTDTPGATIGGDPENVIVLNTNIEIVKAGGLGGGMLGNTYIGPYIGHVDFANIGWLYGPNFAAGFLTDSFDMGLTIIHGNFGLNLIGDAGAGLLAGFPIGENSFGAGGYYHYGGMAELYFSAIGFAAGGGMAGKGMLSVDGFQFVSFPFLELDLMFSDPLYEIGSGSKLYFQYYPRGTGFSEMTESLNFVEQFGIGFKLNPF